MRLDQWQTYYLMGIAALAAIALMVMLVYRHRHKTNIETDLLLRQMRITSRMRAALDVQSDRIKQLESFNDEMLSNWERQRSEVRGRCDYDMGEMPMPPGPGVDISTLFRDLEV